MPTPLIPAIALPPLTVPMFDATGGMAPVWQWYLYQVFTSAQAIQAQQVLEAFDASSGDHALEAASDAAVNAAAGDLTAAIALALDALRKQVAAIAEISDPAAALEAIRKQLTAIAEGPHQAARIDSLEKLIWILTGAGNPPSSAGGGVVLFDTHANRLASYPAADYKPGALFYETDRQVFYIDKLVSGTPTWVYASGVYTTYGGGMPSDLGAADDGFIVQAQQGTPGGQFFRWDGYGSAWSILQALADILFDNHANRGSYPPANYAAGTLFFEADRQIFYRVQYISGAYRWVLCTGAMPAATASRPSDLGIYDVGFLFIDTTLGNLEYWTGSAWVTVGAPPSGSAGGDLSGTYPNPTVAKIQGNAVKNAAPSDGNVLTWVAADSKWEPVAPPGASGSAGGDLSGTYPNPTVAKIQGNAVKNAAPSDGNVLTWVAADSKWEPVAPSAGSPSFPASTGYSPSTTNLSSVSATCAYATYGKMTFVRILVIGTTNGSVPTISLPVSPLNDYQTLACVAIITGVPIGVCAVFGFGGALYIYQLNGVAWGTSATSFIISGWYENS